LHASKGNPNQDELSLTEFLIYFIKELSEELELVLDWQVNSFLWRFTFSKSRLVHAENFVTLLGEVAVQKGVPATVISVSVQMENSCLSLTFCWIVKVPYSILVLVL